MGGTFNPPHFGHFAIAEQAAEQLDLCMVLFIPTGRIVYKNTDKSAEGWDRYNMLDMVVSKNPMFDLSDIEITQNETTYTANTLAKLRKIYPNNEYEIYFIVGADSLDYIEKWYKPEKIFEQCIVAVAGRTGFTDENMNEKINILRNMYSADIIRIDVPFIDVSSSMLRKRVKEGKSIRYFTDDSIIEYISNKGIYKACED